MTKIFVSYRRSDSASIATKIYNRLAAYFGHDAIFKDIENAPLGVDFRDYLSRSLNQCQVFLVVIGPNWLTAVDSSGRRLLDNSADWVRIEIEESLRRKKMSVVPLLVNSADMPWADELPESLMNLAFYKSIQIRSEPFFHKDISQLILKLDEYLVNQIYTLKDTNKLFAELQQYYTRQKSRQLLKQSEDIPANLTFSFEAVTVDQKGDATNRQQMEAEYRIEDLGNGTKLELIRIPSGKFQMGSIAQEKGSRYEEQPQHWVEVSEFWIGKFPVTQAQYQALGELDAYEQSNYKANHPANRVNWYDAVRFCDKLTQHFGKFYRLPSEAEWEYACRAKTTTPFHFGMTLTPDLANYNGIYKGKTTEVGSFPPNAFGLFDMHGNVWEWCQDVWHYDYQGAPTDGTAWLSVDEYEIEKRIRRGGSCSSSPQLCSSTFRGKQAPGFVFNSNSGFRVVYEA